MQVSIYRTIHFLCLMQVYGVSPFSCWMQAFPSAMPFSIKISIFHAGCRPFHLQGLSLQSQFFFMLDIGLDLYKVFLYRASPFSCQMQSFPSTTSLSTNPALFHARCRPRPLPEVYHLCTQAIKQVHFMTYYMPLVKTVYPIITSSYSDHLIVTWSTNQMHITQHLHQQS